MSRRLQLIVRHISVGIIMTSFCACGVLIGNVKPVAEKSNDYGVLDLSKENKDWERLDSRENAEAEITDISYQSHRTASSVTLNSACRESLKARSQPLNNYTKSLLLGITDIDQKEEQEITVNGVPALQTTVQGKMNNEPIKLRAVVIKKDDCLFDLIYVARPQHFPEQENDFTRFVQSLRLK